MAEAISCLGRECRVIIDDDDDDDNNECSWLARLMDSGEWMLIDSFMGNFTLGRSRHLLPYQLFIYSFLTWNACLDGWAGMLKFEIAYSRS